MPDRDAYGRALHERQLALLQALAGQRPAPTGVDPTRLASVQRALRTRQAIAVSSAWPFLSRLLRDRFLPLFLDYADRAKPDLAGDTWVIGRRFVAALEKRKDVHDAVALSALAFDLTYRLVAGRPTPRKLALGYRLVNRNTRLVIGFKLPWLGTHVINLPFGTSQSKQEFEDG